MQYPTPPPIDQFGHYVVPSGRVWQPGPDWDTRDDGCVAVAFGPLGWVAIADTKRPETATNPLCFTAKEWVHFCAKVVASFSPTS